MKGIIYYVSTILFLLIFYFFSIKNKDVNSYRCVTQLEQKSFDRNKQDSPVQAQLNASVNLFFTNKDNGFFSITGNIEYNGKIYNLNRNTYFSIAPKTLNGLKKIIIIKDEEYPTDNTPKEIWNNLITPQIVGSNFYANIKKINSNTLVISSLSFPYLICVIQED